MAEFFNPVFLATSAVSSSLGNGILGGIAATQLGQALNPLQQSLEAGLRSGLSPITNNRILGPAIGQILSGLTTNTRSTTFVAGTRLVLAPGPLASARSRRDPLWLHNFDAAFVGPAGDSLSSDLIEDIDLPFYHFDRLSHYRGGKNYYYPGDYDLSQFSIRFYEDRTLTVTRFLTDWKGKIRNKNNTVNMPGFYKRTIEVYIKDDRRHIVGTARIKGCWPVSINPISFNSASPDRVIMSAEFSADDVELVYNSTDSNTGDFARADRGPPVPYEEGLLETGDFSRADRVQKDDPVGS